MRAQVIRSFKDIQAKLALRKEGDVLEAPEERINELAAKGFVKPIAEPKPEPEVEETPKEEKKPKARKKAAKKK